MELEEAIRTRRTHKAYGADPVDRQTLAGSVSTGTHGTGLGRPSLSAQIEAIELVTADGELRTIDAGEELEAARIGLGALRGNFLGYDRATVVTADFAGR